MEIRGDIEKINTALIARLADLDKFDEFRELIKLVDYQIEAIRQSFKVIENESDIRFHNTLCAEMEAYNFIKRIPQTFREAEDTKRQMDLYDSRKVG